MITQKTTNTDKILLLSIHLSRQKSRFASFLQKLEKINNDENNKTDQKTKCLGNSLKENKAKS